MPFSTHSASADALRLLLPWLLTLAACGGSNNDAEPTDGSSREEWPDIVQDSQPQDVPDPGPDTNLPNDTSSGVDADSTADLTDVSASEDVAEVGVSDVGLDSGDSADGESDVADADPDDVDDNDAEFQDVGDTSVVDTSGIEDGSDLLDVDAGGHDAADSVEDVEDIALEVGVDASEPDGGTDAGPLLPADSLRIVLQSVALDDGATAASTGPQRLFVATRRTLAITNLSDRSAMISVQTEARGDGRPEEWRIVRSASDGTAAELERMLGPGETWNAGLEYMPVRSGAREAWLAVGMQSDAGARTSRVLLQGSASDSLLFSPQASPSRSVAWSWGVPATASSLRAGSLAVDADGNQYVTGTARRWLDGAAPNIVVSRISREGTADWARELQLAFGQESPDPGQNSESGGAAGCIDVDAAHVWVVGRSATDAVDSAYIPVLLQIDRDTGALTRGVQLYPTGTRPVSFTSGAQAYAVDASHPDRVFVVGTSQGQLQIMIWAVSKTDGSLLWLYHLDPATGTTDRGYGIRYRDGGELYVSGLSGSRAFAARIGGADSNSPSLLWAQQMFLGVGTNLPAVDVDAEGNSYYAVDVRGTATQLRLMRLDRDGGHEWSRVFDRMDRTELHNSHGVSLHENTVYLSGRIGLSGYDRAQGDGAIVASDLSGNYQWSMMYYGGTTAERGAMHRIKQVFAVSGRLYALAEIYVAAANTSHYDGYWYTVPDSTVGLPAGDGSSRWTEVSIEPSAITDVTATAGWTRVTEARHADISSTSWVVPVASSSFWPLGRTTGPGNHTLIGGFILSSTL